MNQKLNTSKEINKKSYTKKAFGFVSSRFLFFTIGLFISIAVLTAYAAWDTPAAPGEALTAIKWNDVINKIDELDNLGTTNNDCRWVDSLENCETGIVKRNTECNQSEYVRSVRTHQTCNAGNSTYRTVTDLYCCKLHP